MANEWIEPLLNLQERDIHCDHVVSQLAAIPKEIEKEQSAIRDVRDQIKDRENGLKQLEVGHRDLEGQVELLEQSLVKYKTQQMQVKKNEEFTALEHEIGNTKSKIDKLETEELELLEKIDREKEGFAQFLKDSETTIASLESRIQALKDEDLRCREQLENSKNAVLDAEAKVPEDVLEDYKDVKKYIKRIPYVVPLSESKCTGCYLKVSGDVDSSVRRYASKTHCGSCGRILYREN